MENRKYKLEPIPSLSGFTLKSMQRGEVGPIVTRLTLFNTINMDDDHIIMGKQQISSILSDLVFPRILNAFSTKMVPEHFFLHAVYIEMHADESKNKVLINEDTHFALTCKLKKGVKLMENDAVTTVDIDHFTSIDKEDRDPNAAAIMLALNSAGWFGAIDLIYNRAITQEKITRAIDFFRAASEELKSSNIKPFYQSLWSCNELLAESLLLLYNFIKLKTPHNKIKKNFEGLCKNYNFAYINDYNKIYQIRNPARYGPPHQWSDKWEKEAPKLFQSTANFLGFVLTFLSDRGVVPSNQDSHKFDISKYKQ